MIVRAAMIEFLIRQWGYETELTGDSDLVVEHIRSSRSYGNVANTLYILEESAQGAPTRSGGTYANLHIGDYRNPDGCASHLASTNFKSVIGGPSALELACDAFQELQTWEGRLKDALIDGVTFEEFIAHGSEMLQRPIAYFDRNLIVLGASPDYWKRGMQNPDAVDSIAMGGQMPPDLAVDLVEDLDYLQAAEELEGFYYESTQHRMFYGINTFDADEYLARLVFSLAEDELRLHRGEEQLIDVFHSFLDKLHLRYAGNAQVISSQNDALHTLVRTELLGIGSGLGDEAGSILESFGWDLDDTFMVVKLVFFEGVHWDTVSLYLCSLLEHTVAKSCSFSDERQIVWTIDMTQAARQNESLGQLEQRVVESLVAILRNYACKAGISDSFRPFTNARHRYLEADRALRIGQIRNPHWWYHRFGDYAFDYLLARCTEELPAGLTCHPALAALIDYDKRNATDYACTLACFLRNSQNTTHAANELYIHRTSFMRRMARIHELADVRLDDPDEVLHLMLSARLMGA